MGTPLADVELAEFKQLALGPVQSSFYYHHARLIDILYGIEKIEQILTDPLILDKHVRAIAGVNRLEGAGQAEAPRGTLHHHYKVDENGLITWANLVIATGQNNNAMNQGVLQAAKQYVKDGKFTEGMLNRVEAVVRTFDPCLSCSTHAFGQMPLALTFSTPTASKSTARPLTSMHSTGTSCVPQSFRSMQFRLQSLAHRPTLGRVPRCSDDSVLYSHPRLPTKTLELLPHLEVHP